MTRVTLYTLLVALCSVAQSQAIYVIRSQNDRAPQPPAGLAQDPAASSTSPPPARGTSMQGTTKTTTPTVVSECNLSPELTEEIRGYQETVDKIIDYVVHGDYKGQTYRTLADLVDSYGPRLTGSGQLEAAIDRMLEWSRSERLENVHTEDVAVPHWVRNNESAWMQLPRLQELRMLGLGSSVGTPPEGLTAEVLVVKDFDDLDKHADQARGKIVVFNPNWVSYGETVKYRVEGASRAAKVGAVASLIRSVTPFSIDSPHTGEQWYSDEHQRIPTACITVEDADMMERMQLSGEKIEVQLTMGATSYPDFISRNTIAEVLGSERPGETVVVSGHLDSWDVGQGAMDDGGGAMISWNAAVVLQRLGLRPRRTVRTILWTGEEQGTIGGLAYFNKHKNESEKFQLMLESDMGTFSPLGLAFSGNQEATCIIQEVMKLLKALNTTKVEVSKDGTPDINEWNKIGVPTGSLYNANERYFWFHHSDGDTMNVENPDDLDRSLVIWTAVAYVAADMTHKIPRSPVILPASEHSGIRSRVPDTYS